jgi:hypothetical protein
MVFGTAQLSDSKVAHAYYPEPAAPAGSLLKRGDIWLSDDYVPNRTPSAGNDGYRVLLHEVGHAIGLQHPGSLSAAENSWKYSIMADQTLSYDGMPGVIPSGLMLYDIAALQAVYGANAATRADDTTYKWNIDSPFVYCIWDGGGTDTIDSSPYASPSIIDLREHIENATGGLAADTLVGNSQSNILRGGDGNDALFANGSLYDRFLQVFRSGDPDDIGGDDDIYGEAGDDTIYAQPTDGALLVDGGAGADTLNLKYSGGADLDLSAGTFRSKDGSSSVTSLRVSNIERVVGSDRADTIKAGQTHIAQVEGGDGADLIEGSGNQIIIGGAGSDYLIGSIGDTLDGGTGNDFLKSEAMDFDSNVTLVFGKGYGHDIAAPGFYETVFLKDLLPGDCEFVGTEQITYYHEDGNDPVLGSNDLTLDYLRVRETGDTFGFLADGRPGPSNPGEHDYGVWLGSWDYDNGEPRWNSDADFQLVFADGTTWNSAQLIGENVTFSRQAIKVYEDSEYHDIAPILASIPEEYETALDEFDNERAIEAGQSVTGITATQETSQQDWLYA